MKQTSIKDLLAMRDGTVVEMVRGTIQGVSKYEHGETDGQAWSVQNISISDDEDDIGCRIGNHDEIPIAWVGKPVVLLAAQKPGGKIIGLKLVEETYMEGDLKKSYKLLQVSKSGSITEAKNMATEKPKTTPQPEPVIDPRHQPDPDPEPSPEEVAEAFKEPAPPVEQRTLKPGGMRVSELRYERTVNTGNYCSEKMGVTITLEPGTKAVDALLAAQAFLEKHMQTPVVTTTKG